MSVKTFKRYEYKYLLTQQQYKNVVEGIMPYVKVDPYCTDGRKYSLYNVYYDCEQYDVVRHSVSKPYFKEKLRLRSYYPQPSDDDDVFVELKKKCNGCVNKRRAVMKYKGALSFIETGKADKNGEFIHDQIVKEIECYIKKYPVFHKTYISYEREAYFVKDDKNIRITFDSNLRAGTESFSQTDNVLLIDEDMRIMEIKLSHYMPLWLSKLLCENKIFRQGFSKYGTYYKNHILPERIKLNANIL